MQETINKVKTYLGFSIKSNSILFGGDNIIKSRKMPSLVIICKTAPDKVINTLKHKQCRMVRLKDVTLSQLVERDNVKVIAITNNNLAKAILSFDEIFEALD